MLVMLTSLHQQILSSTWRHHFTRIANPHENINICHIYVDPYCTGCHRRLVISVQSASELRRRFELSTQEGSYRRARRYISTFMLRKNDGKAGELSQNWSKFNMWFIYYMFINLLLWLALTGNCCNKFKLKLNYLWNTVYSS